MAPSGHHRVKRLKISLHGGLAVIGIEERKSRPESRARPRERGGKEEHDPISDTELHSVAPSSLQRNGVHVKREDSRLAPGFTCTQCQQSRRLALVGAQFQDRSGRRSSELVQPLSVLGPKPARNPDDSLAGIHARGGYLGAVVSTRLPL